MATWAAALADSLAPVLSEDSSASLSICCQGLWPLCPQSLLKDSEQHVHVHRNPGLWGSPRAMPRP